MEYYLEQYIEEGYAISPEVGKERVIEMAHCLFSLGNRPGREDPLTYAYLNYCVYNPEEDCLGASTSHCENDPYEEEVTVDETSSPKNNQLH